MITKDVFVKQETFTRSLNNIEMSSMMPVGTSTSEQRWTSKLSVLIWTKNKGPGSYIKTIGFPFSPHLDCILCWFALNDSDVPQQCFSEHVKTGTNLRIQDSNSTSGRLIKTFYGALWGASGPNEKENGNGRRQRYNQVA